MSSACGRPQRGRGVSLMWTGERVKNLDFLVAPCIINFSAESDIFGQTGRLVACATSEVCFSIGLRLLLIWLKARLIAIGHSPTQALAVCCRYRSLLSRRRLCSRRH